MIPKSLYHLLLLILFIISATSKRQVHDISYSELEVPLQNDSSSQQINLTPQRSVFAHWQYPNTWDVTQLLSNSLDNQITLPKLSNIDASISFIKDKVSRFLKLTDKAELLAKNIKQLPDMKNDISLIPNENQFKALQLRQSNLSALNQQIDFKAIEIQNILQELMIEQQNPLFKQAALNFEKKALVQKISLYQKLSDTAAYGKKKAINGQNDKRVTDYFNELDNIFRTESGLIEQIDTLLKNHNELTILKGRVTSLTSQLKAHLLTLSEKQQCARQFQKIKEKQSHDKEVVKLVETLKLKKNQFNEPNKYCEGVVKKLIERVKKLLVGYDYVFKCAQQLNEIKINRDKIQSQLDEAQKKLDQLQLSKGVETFRSNFENNRQLIQKKVKSLKSLQLDDFYMQPGTLQSVITEAKNRITQIDQTITNLPVKTDLDLTQIQQIINKKVSQIKVIKASYCKENDAYKRQAQIIQSRLIKLEQQEEYNTWVKNLLVDKFEELERVKAQMRQLKTEITQHLQDQTTV